MNPLKQHRLDHLLTSLRDEDEYVFLDSARIDTENQQSFLFVRPLHRLEFFASDDPVVFVKRLEETLAEGYYLAGWISYEFAYLLEPRLAALLPDMPTNVPLVSFGVFSKPFVYDHQTGENDFPVSDRRVLPDFKIAKVRPSLSRASYLDAVARIKEYIAAGDTYQVNYTLKLFFDFTGSVESFYRHLRANQSVSYGALMRLGQEHILSLSPELFFRVEEDRVVVRPMKGTMKRGRDFEEDLRFCETLATDPKNRSENVMIVDLLRNDLGRLTHQCGDEKVITESLFDVERYESVLQMTSTIVAQTGRNVFSQRSLMDFLKALYPCGSVTGAPKIRTMEIIRELEKLPRGVYTGAIGFLAPDGRGTFNVPIRTIRLAEGKGEMGIGSGIVQDSDPAQEWEECLLKAHFLTKPVQEFYLIETLLLEKDSGYYLLDYHLERLQQSATYFSFYYDDKSVCEILEGCRQTNDKEYLRVRLSLQKDGTLDLESVACERPKQHVLPRNNTAEGIENLPVIELSTRRIDSASPFFFHKTSNRELFNAEFKRAADENLFDVVFVNERDELTEGCISNIVLFLDGRYVTPPVSSGLLAGTMRRKLLAGKEIPVYEQIVYVEDLQRADAVYCCNSVRGVVRVQWSAIQKSTNS